MELLELVDITSTSESPLTLNEETINNTKGSP